jgi:hypothetical protein
LNAALLCIIYGAMVENTLFEDDDGVNTFRTFNSTRAFFKFERKSVIDPLRSAG